MVEAQLRHAWIDANRRGGLGWVIRDSSGSLIGAGCVQVDRKWSIKAMEGQAIIEGLKAYHSLSNKGGVGVKPPLIVEFDSFDVVKAINGEEEDLSEIALVVDSIVEKTRGEVI